MPSSITASDNSCGGELGTRLGYVSSGDLHSFVSSWCMLINYAKVESLTTIVVDIVCVTAFIA